MDADAALICVGVITGPRGLRGEVRVKSFTARPEDIGAYGPLLDEDGQGALGLRVTGRHKDHLIARVEGVEDRNGAEALKGARLYLRRQALPEPDDEEYYHADLIGLRAERRDGGAPGTVKAVHDFGAGDILEIDDADGNGVMVPFTRQAVPVVDLAAGRLIIDPPPGLLDAAADGGVQ